VNAALFLDVHQTGSDGHKGLQIKEAHVVFGYDQLKGGLPSSSVIGHLLNGSLQTLLAVTSHMHLLICYGLACAYLWLVHAE